MDKLSELIEILEKERGDSPRVVDETQKFNYFRSLVNVRYPFPASPAFIELQDEYLSELLKQRGVTDAESLRYDGDGIALWKGDITTLKVGAIVNAANSQMLGCFYPCHKCIDNAIHTFAGVQLRQECHQVMSRKGREAKTSEAILTKAYNLPCKYILHTVGPIVYGTLTEKEKSELALCYRNCLELAVKNNVGSVAFCCISTGEFHFPNDVAAKIAVRTVRKFKREKKCDVKVVFNVFKERDHEIYRKLLGQN